MMSESEKLNEYPANELFYHQEGERLTWQEVLDVFAYGKLLLNKETEERLYLDIGLTTPEKPFYPVIEWNTPREAAAQEIFTDKPTGRAVECHFVGQQICDALKLGNPGAQYTGRGFRGRAYAEAIKGYILDHWESYESHAFYIKEQHRYSKLRGIASDIAVALRPYEGTAIEFSLLTTFRRDGIGGWTYETLGPGEMPMAIEDLIEQGFLVARGDGQWLVSRQIKDFSIRSNEPGHPHYHVYATSEEQAQRMLEEGIKSGELRPTFPEQRPGGEAYGR